MCQFRPPVAIAADARVVCRRVHTLPEMGSSRACILTLTILLWWVSEAGTIMFGLLLWHKRTSPALESMSAILWILAFVLLLVRGFLAVAHIPKEEKGDCPPIHIRIVMTDGGGYLDSGHTQAG